MAIGKALECTISHCCGAAVSPQAHCSRGWSQRCALGHPLVVPYWGRQSNGLRALPRLPSPPGQSNSQLQLPWPDAVCQVALNTSDKMYSAKSTNGHVSTVPMQRQRMASVQCPSSIQNQPMVSVECANAMQSQPMATVQCATVKSTNNV